jgi:hypothetical protein
MNKAQLDKAIVNAVKSGNWMIRCENDGGLSPSPNAKGFKWKPIGQWTIAPDFNSRPVCGGGLHGQGFEAGGDIIKGKYLVFCETRGERIVINNNKIKVKSARRLLVGKLPDGLTFKSSLNLSGCDLKGIKLPDSVGGSLYLSGCDLKGIKLPDSVGGYLNLSGCDLKGIKLPDSVGGSLNLSGCDLKGIKLPDSVGGSLYLSGCDLKGIKLPDSVGGYLDLSGCDLKGIAIPIKFKHKVIR